MSSRAATLTGLGAIALWSQLALFTAATGAVPPFQLTAMTFVVAGSLGLAIAAGRGRARPGRAPPGGGGVGGVGGFGGPGRFFPGPERLGPAARDPPRSL